MNPVFIRRGKILFLLKSPEDFLKSLWSGKFRPTDRLLVKDGTAIEWIPIADIQQFRLGANFPGGSNSEDYVLQSPDLLDRIRQPRFNIAALFLGGWWYYKHGMPRRGLFRLSFAALVMFGLSIIGLSVPLPLIPLFLLILAGWFGSGLLCALRADHDLNLLQLARFHQGAKESVEDSLELDVLSHLKNDLMDLRVPAPKDKIFN